VKYGVTLPNGSLGDDPRVIVDLAVEAERAGWDGVFLWDALDASHEIAPEPRDRRLLDAFDVWALMAAIATATERVIIGPLVTAVTRRRPWKLARECTTLDRLSRGRFVLSVGLGWTPEGAFAKVNEQTDRRVRAERLDEGLAVLEGLSTGEPLQFAGKHYRVDGLQLLPRPVRGRVPVWVVAAWPSERSMARALRFDGVVPARLGSFDPVSADEVRELRVYVAARRERDAPFDVVFEGTTPGHDPAAYADAGVTWWLEGVWAFVYDTPGSPDLIRARIQEGPPRV
jgi:alkanesulfonate monooxygenase SsuD/methylene tetrahydromethanopterin reductase-like flavin-dependent oxidoreductase (luciferase family)